jgi:hypothetical protein
VLFCWRLSPLLLVVLLALRARWLTGVLANSGRAGSPAAGSTSGHTASSAAATAAAALRGGSPVSQFFVWFFIIIGAFLVFALVAGLVNMVISEIKLQIECHRAPDPTAHQFDRRGR